MLHIALNHPSKTWRADEISPVEAVAERAATAMNNVRSFQVTRKCTSIDRLIFEASTKIGDVLNMENILRTIAQELERVLGGSDVLLQFKSEEKA